MSTGTTNGVENRVSEHLSEKADEKPQITVDPAELAKGLLARLGSKGRVKGSLVVNGIEISKATLRSGVASYTDEEFDKALSSKGLDVSMQVDATFHGVFRATRHTDRVIGDNALEFIAELAEANEASQKE